MSRVIRKIKVSVPCLLHLPFSNASSDCDSASLARGIDSQLVRRLVLTPQRVVPLRATTLGRLFVPCLAVLDRFVTPEATQEFYTCERSARFTPYGPQRESRC